MRNVTYYEHHTGKLEKPLLFAVISDLHNEPYEDLFALIDGADALLVPGDISDRYRKQFDRGVAFLADAAKRLPTFFSLGNHETRQEHYRTLRRELDKTGAEILVNRFVRFGEVTIGGWYDPKVVKEKDMMNRFVRQEGAKVLLCHKPEMYIKHLRGREIDLVVAGHAHGGQIRLGQQGVYSPGQGLFPRYTRGVVDGRMIISAGAGNPARMPRWNNPCEVLLIHMD